MLGIPTAFIRHLDIARPEEILWVAERMRRTLIEVLGRAEGEALYTMDWLEQRVRYHLNGERCLGAVFISSLPDGCRLGYTIVRQELDGLGLFSTTYVERSWRRQGVAQALLQRGEEWMRQQGLRQAVTYTADHNLKLQKLYLARGYLLEAAENGFVRLQREL
ncbi:GNAT family N-acetyltransferase [bacterium]|nr:GNAT family N-acetyltransferase [bacterium]